MRLSQLFVRTLRQVSSEADTVSHQLLLRAGMIHQVAAGVYSYLPLAWKVLRKIEQIVREEMDAAGGQELMMPALQPLEMWQESGRDVAFGQSLFVLKDRRQRKLCLGPTHEEVITEMVRHSLRSYRDLPLLLYQIQTKFRDEPRPRSGLIRVREFTMKDLYSFDVEEEAADISYRKMIQAYKNIYDRCGLPAMLVEADSGAIGGKESHEFMVIAESGENQIIYCHNCDYAANVERATSIKPTLKYDDPLLVEEVATPGIKTIPDLARFLNITESQTMKAVFYSADGELVFVTIRGDLEVNEVKLRNALKCYELRLATDEELQRVGIIAGFASPIDVRGIKTVADDSITLGTNFVAGANKPDTHLKNVNYPRDFKVDLLTDIATAKAKDRCPKCNGSLNSLNGIEVGHTFKLGTYIGAKPGPTYLDKEGNQQLAVMGCYGIGIGRLLAAAVEQNHDDKGIIWPAPLAPYQVHLCALSMDDPEVLTKSEELYTQLKAEGIEVLYDDRLESPGVKFNDVDLLGMPIRLTISPRTLKSNSVELKHRTNPKMELVPLDQIFAKLKQIIQQ